MKKKVNKRKRIPGTAEKDGRPTRMGANMLKGGGWTLISPYKLEFKATLLETVNEGDVRVAIFRVPKPR